MKYNPTIKALLFCFILLSLTSCGSQKAAVRQQTGTATKTAEVSKEEQGLRFVQRVSDNRLYQKNLVANLSCNIKLEGKDITLPGALHMRKDEVIRLQLFMPFVGSELARIEFSPTEVLAIDRIHKEYVQADYTQLSFLKENGLTFYSLQALFWNQLALPGKQQVSEADLKLFEVELSEALQQKIKTQQGDITYCWEAEKESALITHLQAVYGGKTHGQSSLSWDYSQFRAFGSKMYPTKQIASFTTAATNKTRTVTLTLELDTPQAEANWDSRSTVSGKYKRIETEDIFGKIMNL